MTAQEAALKMANSEPRCLFARNLSFDWTDVEMGGPALFYEPANRQSTSRRRGPAAILESDKTGATVKFQGRAFKVATYCVCWQTAPKDLGETAKESGPGEYGRFGRAAFVSTAQAKW